MATKPTQLPRWATAATPDPASQPAPGAGKQDVGWKTGERPPAYYQNWLQYWNYKWAEYLNDGALQGPHTFNSTVGVTGTLTASGLIQANAGVTAGANQHVTVSGTGQFKHGDRIRTISAIAGQTVGDWSGALDGSQVTLAGTSTNMLLVPLSLLPGDRLKSVSWYTPTGFAGLVDWRIYSQIGTGAHNQLTSQSAGSIAAGVYTSTPGSPVTLVNGESIYYAIQAAFGAGFRVVQFQVTYDHP